MLVGLDPILSMSEKKRKSSLSVFIHFGSLTFYYFTAFQMQTILCSPLFRSCVFILLLGCLFDVLLCDTSWLELTV